MEALKFILSFLRLLITDDQITGFYRYAVLGLRNFSGLSKVAIQLSRISTNLLVLSGNSHTAPGYSWVNFFSLRDIVYTEGLGEG